jgi:anthranilate phosphoribosyltransferase
MARGERSAIAGGDAPGNAQALVAILEGAGHAARDAVLLNAAAALVVATGDEPKAAVERARKAIDGGAAKAVLETWRRVARRVRGE